MISWYKHSLFISISRYYFYSNKKEETKPFRYRVVHKNYISNDHRVGLCMIKNVKTVFDTKKYLKLGNYTVFNLNHLLLLSIYSTLIMEKATNSYAPRLCFRTPNILKTIFIIDFNL